MTFESTAPANIVQRLVTRALRDPVSVLESPPAELDLTLRLLRRARLLGRFAADLKGRGRCGGLDPVVADQLDSALVVAEARTRVALWELNRIAWALRSVPDVPLVALKGCGYLLAGTPNVRGRTFADVDLLVPEAQLATVEVELQRHGWRPADVTAYDDRYYRAWAHELPPLRHPERDVEVDLHHGILMRTARLRPSSQLLLEASQPVAEGRFRVLAPVDMVLHAIVHLFYGGEMDDALRELVDIADLLQHFATTAPGFWDQFWPRAEQLDLVRPAYYALRYAQAVLGAGVPDRLVEAAEAGAPPAPVRLLMDRLVPKVLFPRHPDVAASRVELARPLLYLRSHWVKMPPLMLVRHLGYKSYVRYRGHANLPPGQVSA